MIKIECLDILKISELSRNIDKKLGIFEAIGVFVHNIFKFHKFNAVTSNENFVL